MIGLFAAEDASLTSVGANVRMQALRRCSRNIRASLPLEAPTAVMMASYDASDEDLSRSELAWELVELFGELPVEQINEVLAKNVPIETLEFFASYAGDFAKVEKVCDGTSRKLPNLLLLGYLLRVLEDRLIDEPIDLDS
jgi:hypothetical protein